MIICEILFENCVLAPLNLFTFAFICKWILVCWCCCCILGFWSIFITFSISLLEAGADQNCFLGSISFRRGRRRTMAFSNGAQHSLKMVTFTLESLKLILGLFTPGWYSVLQFFFPRGIGWKVLLRILHNWNHNSLKLFTCSTVLNANLGRETQTKSKLQSPRFEKVCWIRILLLAVDKDGFSYWPHSNR
jgi:hypothetical protein